MVVPELTVGMGAVFGVVLLALVLFALEPVPVDITAIGVMIALMLLGPDGVVDLTGITIQQGLSGFASTATITVLAMFILSDGVQRTGIVQTIGARVVRFTRESETLQLGATIGVVGPISGFINNTAAVAILLPMVTDIANEGRTSPSKLLIPLSFASMFGGMLTLIGTSTNILASELVSRPEYLGEPFSMFTFTALGAVVFVVGTVYLLTLGRFLIPERIKPQEDLTEEFGMGEYLTEVVVRDDSPVIGQTVRAALEGAAFDVDLLQLVRDGQVFLEPLGPKTIQAGDLYVVRTDRDTLIELLDVEGFDLIPDVDVDEAELEQAEGGQNLVEVVIAPGAFLAGETLASASFRQRYDATVLALRRGGEVIRQRMDRTALRVGDTLLVQAPSEAIDRLNANRNFIVAQEVERPDFRTEKVPVAVGIVLGVVGIAAFTPISIVVTALGGAVAMVVTGCLKPTEVYESVQWDVIFLLAGLIPLGLALTNTQGDQLIAGLLVAVAGGLPIVAVIALLYLVTAALTNVISNNAAVVLMIPVAAQTAQSLGSGLIFAFVIAVTFAASTAFMTPVGYQTNLFVYGPGGYRFTDYARVGTPLQLLFAVATTAGIWWLYL